MTTNIPLGFTLISVPPLKSRGFTLIELMVGIIVSLIGTLAIMAAFAVFEGQKRTTTSGDDAQQSGSYSLYTLERQIRTAGSGLVQGNRYGVWGCPITAVTANAGSFPPSLAGTAFASWPAITRAVSVLISSGGKVGGVVQPDIIGIVSGSPAGIVFKSPVLTATSGSSITLTNAFGITSGDYLLGPLTSGQCALALTTGSIPAPVAGTPPPAIALDSTNSPATGLQTATNVFDMGPDPVISLYTVDTNTASTTFNSLVTFDMLQRQVNGAAAAVTPVADGIVMIKALYGIHTGAGCADPNCIDKWVAPTSPYDIVTLNATTATASGAMAAIKAVRVAVVAQSRISQRTQDYGTGKSSLTLFTDLPALSVTVTTDPTYRYKVYDTTIPIRNALITKYF